MARSRIHRADLAGGGLFGSLLDNEANAKRSGSGFNPLFHTRYPGVSLYRPDGVGLNFEHIFNGAAKDHDRCMFTPRKDLCTIEAHSDCSASLCWPAEGSAWGIECKMRYTFCGSSAIDLAFTARLTRDEFPLGYVVFMWASYMNRTQGRPIRFYGRRDGEEGWISFGDDTPDGFETGTVSCQDVPDLPYEEGAQTLNLIENRSKKFTLPFYYGLVDGGGQPDAPGDTMVYIMMFDQREPIRFALWNFITGADGKPDPHSPAWDWQYVIRNPEAGKEYGYKARVVYKPFVSEDDVRQEYKYWEEER